MGLKAEDAPQVEAPEAFEQRSRIIYFIYFYLLHFHSDLFPFMSPKVLKAQVLRNRTFFNFMSILFKQCSNVLNGNTFLL